MWDKGRAEFRCRQCGALYHCTYEDLPSRVQGEHFCEDCGALVHSWVGSRDYDDWKIVRIRPA
jgi:peptide subunit release factor 1 (eRF1)